MAGALRRQRVRDLLELVGRACVLGLRVVVEVEDAVLVDRDVLEDRAEGASRPVDLRLGGGREPDHLRVAAALDVEDARVAPAVLVVSDQEPLRVGREGRLARAGEPEEDRHLPVLAEVRGAVHRKDAFERKAVVHHGEDRLLDLAGVEGAPDQDLAPARMEHDEGAAARPVLDRVGLDRRRVQDECLRLELGEILRGRLDEERLGEERVVRVVGDDADADPVLGIGACERVDDVHVALGVGGDDLVAEAIEQLLLEGLVDASPPDPVLGAGLAHHELVLR